MGEQKKVRRRRGRREKKKGNVVSNIILVIAIIIFIYAGFNLWQIFSEYDKGTSEYESIQDLAIMEVMPSATEDDLPIFRVDFNVLKGINSDVIGWIRFEEPSQINYPIVRGVDNAKYLTTTFEGNYNSAGTLFADMANSDDFSDPNTFIYGHNMKNGSMFGMLRKYRDRDFCMEHPYFYIYTPDGMESTYQVFATTVVNDPSESYDKQYADEAEFASYISYVRSLSLYSTDVDVSGNSKIVSLSTCTNRSDEERLLIHAVKVSEKSTLEEE